MAAELANTLLDWYGRHARELPWRSEPSPYHVLLSELMLQQTRVETVRPYFERFRARWPRMEDLAAAREQEVVEAWAGLGYYRRARYLHRAARAAVARGGLPRRVEDLRELPGIGPYTAGAIASIAWDLPAPAIDGNVERVIARLDAVEHSPKRAAGRRRVHARVEALLSHGSPRQVSQALMELGATVCLPRQPDCAACPWSARCAARAEGRIDELPRREARRKPTPVRGVAGLLYRADGAVLLAQRAPEGLLGGLWEPVASDDIGGTSARPALTRVVRERVGLEVRVGERLGEVKHVFSHRKLRMPVFRLHQLEAGAPRALGGYQAVRFEKLAPEQLERGRRTPVALSSLACKLLQLGESSEQLPLPLAADGP